MPAELSPRQKTILDAVIREYVATAEPVASGELARKYRLGLSSATIRGELFALDETGYLTQPHTSAGRVPTDKGYRFFINHIAAGDPLSRQSEPKSAPNREERALRELAHLDDPAEFAKETGRLIAHLTRNFVLAGFPGEDLFYKTGLAEVMQEPEFSDQIALHAFSALLDTIEDEIGRCFRPAELEEPRTFIGSENPIARARPYGMIVGTFATPFRQESVIALIGPKRMDYERNVALLKHLREVLNTTYD